MGCAIGISRVWSKGHFEVCGFHLGRRLLIGLTRSTKLFGPQDRQGNFRIGLQVDGTDGSSIVYAIAACHNYWGARSGPSGDGPLGTELTGSGEEIIRDDNDAIEVIPFRRGC